MTTESPIRKLYKRCKRGRHAECPGSHAAYSVCECTCHVMDGAAAIEAAQAIVTAEPKPVIDLATMTEVKPKRAVKATKATRDTVTARHEADYGLRGLKNQHAYGFFDPCDEHATEENAIIIAFGRSETGARRQIAASAIGRLLRGCGECKERTRSALAAFARTQGDVVQAIAHKYPTKTRPTRMSRETFIAKYDDGRALIADGNPSHPEVRSAVVRCANRDHQIRHGFRDGFAQIILHDTDQPCAACVDIYKPRTKRSK